MEARGGIELEPICGRERSGSPQAKSRAPARDLICQPAENPAMEARGGIEPPIEVLQTSALPLGDRAAYPPQQAQNRRLLRPGLTKNPRQMCESGRFMERETGFEPATSTLARSHSTTELLPLGRA